MRPQRGRRADAALAEQLQRLTDEAALNDAVIRLQASELASARVSLPLTPLLALSLTLSPVPTLLNPTFLLQPRSPRCAHQLELIPNVPSPCCSHATDGALGSPPSNESC